MTIDINGDVINEITIDGEFTKEVTVDGDVVFQRTPIPDSVLAQDLVAWYRFEDGDARDYTATLGATFADSTAYDGTVNGATYQSGDGVTDFKNGSNSGAFVFGGGDDYINLGSNNALKPQPATYTLWAKTNTTDRGVVWGGDGNDNNIYLQYRIPRRDNSKIGGNFGGGGFAVGPHDGDFPGTNTWFFTSVTVDNSGVARFYIGNDFNNPKFTVNDGGSNRDKDILIGNRTKSGNMGWRGGIDDVRIYNRVLSSTERENIYNATKP